MQNDDSSGKFKKILSDIIAGTKAPIVMYTGLLGLANAFDCPRDRLPMHLFSIINEVIGTNRDLLMPTYTNGFLRDSILDLDATPGTTGMINEAFRKSNNAARTVSAFFSFAVRGPSSNFLTSLRPNQAWGDNSLFEWFENTDALLIMLGVPWDRCSFLHRAEWLAQVPYRYEKKFSGKIKINNKLEELCESLFVRSLDPLVENIWTGIDKILISHGMQSFALGRSSISVLSAKKLTRAITTELRADPFKFVKNKEIITKTFHNKGNV